MISMILLVRAAPGTLRRVPLVCGINLTEVGGNWKTLTRTSVISKPISHHVYNLISYSIALLSNTLYTLEPRGTNSKVEEYLIETGRYF